MVRVRGHKYRPEVKVADADLAPYFEAHQEQYPIGEKRKIRFCWSTSTGCAPRRARRARIERAYNDGIELY